MAKRLPPAVAEFFRKQGAKGGKIGGKMALETMTAAERKARATKAGQASAAARKAKADRAKYGSRAAALAG
jgi:uncharacterized protein YdaU (DUF1376 family)